MFHSIPPGTFHAISHLSTKILPDERNLLGLENLFLAYITADLVAYEDAPVKKQRKNCFGLTQRTDSD